MSIAIFLLGLGTSDALAQSFRLPEPTPVAASRVPVVLTEAEREEYLSDWRQTARRRATLALIRSSFGGQAFYLNGQGIGGSFALGLEGGARFLVAPGDTGFALVPTLAARLTAGDLASQTFSAGLGLSYDGMEYSMTATARGVAGWFEGAEALGFDYGINLELGNIVGIEVDHQVLYVDGLDRPMHALRVLFTFDFAPLLHALNGTNYYEDR